MLRLATNWSITSLILMAAIIIASSAHGEDQRDKMLSGKTEIVMRHLPYAGWRYREMQCRRIETCTLYRKNEYGILLESLSRNNPRNGEANAGNQPQKENSFCGILEGMEAATVEFYADIIEKRKVEVDGYQFDAIAKTPDPRLAWWDKSVAAKVTRWLSKKEDWQLIRYGVFPTEKLCNSLSKIFRAYGFFTTNCNKLEIGYVEYSRSKALRDFNTISCSHREIKKGFIMERYQSLNDASLLELSEAIHMFIRGTEPQAER